MGIINSNKELSVSQINCNGSFQVRLSLTATPNIVTNPTDIILLLDRSGSMAGSALANLKNGAKAFIDIIDEATGGASGQIGSGSRIAIVSFADIATKNTQLITSVSDLKAAVDGITAGGGTNHADAFNKASELLAGPSLNAKVIVMFTDGNTTAGPNPSVAAAEARANGAVIYSIGLSGSDGVDVSALEDWSSKPSSSYVIIAPNDTELEDLFEDLARNISKPGATDISITDTVASCFRITSVSIPTKGTASIINSNSVRWQIDELGVTQTEGAQLTFNVEHIGPCSGSVEVNQSISYTDNENNVVSFPSPEIDIGCDIVVLPEVCPDPIDVAVDGCEDSVEFDAGNILLDSLGCIVTLNVTLQNVCPGKRVALAAILNEVDDQGNEYKRGLKTMAIPAHTREFCSNVFVQGIKFVLPESLDVRDQTGSNCNARNFKARFIAHYIDNDYECNNITLM